ncbi:vWA domain-containing protein [Thiohalobacter sp. IOR34]|uniref:vWA domain-containing protein n=1 Tax=Thiohalobacter sp. IOR34 TaxID=3057176 RepID=UPI0025B0C406|nr:vWA domain-containing protein [Thiohalobacter sp. IOR34]WJW76819.1 vWA domain-containing protein [Thiohalobacter sp. IOR34]
MKGQEGNLPMPGMPARVLAALLLWCLAWMAPFAIAADEGTAAEGVDAVLVIDSSGSMKETDPRRLRVAAAKMFVSLLGPEDRTGLISFSDDGYPVLHLTPATPANRERLFKGIEKVSARGVYTNLHAALLKGREMLDKEGRPGHRRLLVLMSDGKMDVGDWNEDQRLKQQIRGSLIEALRNSGIEVYTIAFTEASDMTLLREIADGTGALSRMASNDRELHKVFSAIFESAKQPDMLPIEGGDFVVDDSVDEVTIIASKVRPDSEIQLLMPDGRRITAEVAGRAVRWFRSEGFDMITIQGPPPGRWHLVSDSTDNRAYVVTDMGIEARLAAERVKVGESNGLKAWLVQNGELLATPEILATTRYRVDVEQPDGSALQVELNNEEPLEDGVYEAALQFQQPGQYRLKVSARSQTFQREKVLYLDVEPLPEGAAPPPVVAEPEPEPQPVAESEPEPEPEPQPPAEPAAEAPEVEEPPPALQEEELLTEEPADEGINVGLIISLFVLVNLLIGGLVAGFIFWKKRRGARAAEKVEDADDEDVAE